MHAAATHLGAVLTAAGRPPWRVQDMFTSMTSASKPHHVVDADGVTLGYTHFGMLAAARWIRAQVPFRCP
jgi:cytochrome bd-type quinol oxidase subunit 1